MNSQQEGWLWICIIAFIGMGLIPPWYYKTKPYKPLSFSSLRDKSEKDSTRGEENVRKNDGYYCIFLPPSKEDSHIDFTRLFLQWGLVLVGLGLLLYSSRSKPMIRSVMPAPKDKMPAPSRRH